MKERPIIFSQEMVNAIRDGRKTQTRRVIKKQPIIDKEFNLYHYKNDSHFYKSDEEFIQHEFVHNGGYEDCPYGQVGDFLWVRETTFISECGGFLAFLNGKDHYTQDVLNLNNTEWSFWLSDKHANREIVGQRNNRTSTGKDDGCTITLTNPRQKIRFKKKKPSIFMPKTACRLKLEITDIRVERLQDISETDATAEGGEPAKIELMAACFQTTSARNCYRDGFKSLWDSINAKKSPWKDNAWVWVIEFEYTEEV